MKNSIICNKAKCKLCNEIIISYHRHDYISCKCDKIAIDGGNEYLRRIGKSENIEDLTVYSDAPYKIIRENFHRGGRGKDGNQPLTWVPLNKMSDEWLKACFQYNIERGLGDSFANQMYAKELNYRKQNKIKINE